MKMDTACAPSHYECIRDMENYSSTTSECKGNEQKHFVSPPKTTKGAFCLAPGVACCLTLGFIAICSLMSDADSATRAEIKGQYVVQLNKSHYTNGTLVANFVRSLDLSATTDEGEFVLMHEYNNLGSLGLLGFSAKMSLSAHATLLKRQDVLSVEPDMHIQVTKNDGEGCETQADASW